MSIQRPLIQINGINFNLGGLQDVVEDVEINNGMLTCYIQFEECHKNKTG